MSLERAWRNRILFGRDLQEAPAPVRPPGILSLILLLLAVSSFALPGMRQGIMTILDSWNIANASLQPAQLEKMGREAEENHDATTLGFVAMRLRGNSQDKSRLADLAVSWDPSLTWIYFQMQDSYRSVDSGQIARLQKWDPNNAVPYLMEADDALEEYEHRTNYSLAERSSIAAANELAKDPVWAVAMDKAFRASHFDDYLTRRFDLNMTTQRKFAMNHPTDLVLSTAAGICPNLLNLRFYSAWLIQDGARREAAGDYSGASDDYWRMAQFAQHMALETKTNGLERLIALPMVKQSFEKLQSLYDRTGRSEEAQYAAFEVRNAVGNLEDVKANIRRFYGQEYGWQSWSATMTHLTAQLILVTAILSCVSLLWLALGADNAKVAHSRLHKSLCVIGRYAPALLVFSVAVFYSYYYPCLQAFRSATSQNMENVSYTFWGLYSLPSYFTHGGRGNLYLWSSIFLIGSAVVLFLIARMSFRGRISKEIA